MIPDKIFLSPGDTIPMYSEKRVLETDIAYIREPDKNRGIAGIVEDMEKLRLRIVREYNVLPTKQKEEFYRQWHTADSDFLKLIASISQLPPNPVTPKQK